MSLWYVARRDELLIDLDEYMRPSSGRTKCSHCGGPSRDGGPWGEKYFRLRLQSAIEHYKLKVERVFLVPSHSPRHYHALVKLARPITRLQCLVWTVRLGSDLYRGLNDLGRLAYGVSHPSLLICNEPIAGWRRPDAICKCKSKHVTADQLAMGKRACPTWRKYRGRNPYAIWGPPAEAQLGCALPTGEVPIELIMRKKTRAPLKELTAPESFSGGAVGRSAGWSPSERHASVWGTER